MKHGLIPKVGPRSRKLREEKCVFLFPGIEDAYCALAQWFYECFSENTSLTILKISLPDDFPVLDSPAKYEKITKIQIPPEYIEVFECV